MSQLLTAVRSVTCGTHHSLEVASKMLLYSNRGEMQPQMHAAKVVLAVGMYYMRGSISSGTVGQVKELHLE